MLCDPSNFFSEAGLIRIYLKFCLVRERKHLWCCCFCRCCCCCCCRRCCCSCCCCCCCHTNVLKTCFVFFWLNYFFVYIVSFLGACFRGKCYPPPRPLPSHTLWTPGPLISQEVVTVKTFLDRALKNYLTHTQEKYLRVVKQMGKSFKNKKMNVNFFYFNPARHWTQDFFVQFLSNMLQCLSPLSYCADFCLMTSQLWVDKDVLEVIQATTSSFNNSIKFKLLN